MKCNYENSLNNQKSTKTPIEKSSKMPIAIDISHILSHLPIWQIEEHTGYKPITTFYDDFSIADIFGEAAVLDTFARAMNEWKTNYKYLTELIMVVNWKSWEHYDKGNMELTELYSDLYYKGREYALDNLKGEKLQYYLETTD